MGILATQVRAIRLKAAAVAQSLLSLSRTANAGAKAVLLHAAWEVGYFLTMSDEYAKDVVLASDALFKRLDKLLADIVVTNDGVLTFNVGKLLADVALPLDIIELLTNKPQADGVAMSDAKQLAVDKSTADNVATSAVAETLIRVSTKALSDDVDTAATSEALAVAMFKVLADLIVTSDAASTTGTGGSGAADNVSISEALAKALDRVLAEVAGVADFAALTPIKSFEETLGGADAFTQLLDKAAADGVATAEAWTWLMAQVIADIADPNDAVALALDRPNIADIADPNDVAVLTPGLNYADIADPTDDTLALLLNKAAADVAAATEAVARLVDKAAADAAATVDALARDISTTLADGAATADVATPVLTVAGTDTTPPSQVTGLATTVVSDARVQLNWTMATDDTAVTGYKIERCAGASCVNFVEIGTAAHGGGLGGIGFVDTGLVSNTTYRYQVRATDAANNLGAYSSIVSALTLNAPADMFAAGELGFWFDPSDITTLFQDSAGTTPVTASGQPVGKILDKSGRGLHATQATAGSRPTYQVDAISGKAYLSFDGVDDGLVTAAVNPATDKLTTWLGVHKPNDTLFSSFCESSADPNTVTGTFGQIIPGNAGAQTYGFRTRGTGTLLTGETASGTFPAPRTDVVTMQTNHAAGTTATKLIGRVNGTQMTLTFAGAGGTGNYTSQQVWIGRRNSATLPFTGRMYGYVARFTAAASTAQQVTDIERWMASRTRDVPAQLFAKGELGLWYDPSDLTSMFQDSAGTVPVTAAEQPVGKILDKSGRGNHAIQATAAARPTLKQDVGGQWSLYFDGVDDALVTAAALPCAGDDLFIACGINKPTDTVTSSPYVIELSNSSSSNNGTFMVRAPSSTGNPDMAFRTRGTVGASDLVHGGIPAPQTMVVACASHLTSGNFMKIRLNAADKVSNTVATGNGPFASTFKAGIGRREGLAGGTGVIKIYGLIVRTTTQTTAADITATEQWLFGKTPVGTT